MSQLINSYGVAHGPVADALHSLADDVLSRLLLICAEHQLNEADRHLAEHELTTVLSCRLSEERLRRAMERRRKERAQTTKHSGDAHAAPVSPGSAD